MYEQDIKFKALNLAVLGKKINLGVKGQIIKDAIHIFQHCHM